MRIARIVLQARTAAVLSLLSLLPVSLSVQAMTISPSPSYTGNYTVTWGPTGCQETGQPYPYPPYICYYLYENGNYVTQSSPYNVTGKPDGTYSYYVVADYLYYQETVDSGSVIVGTPPPTDPLQTQLDYQYQIRAGDYQSNGTTDLYVERVSGGVSGNGVLEKVFLWHSPSGGFVPSVPSPSLASLASSWPLLSATPIVADFNVDGFVDVEVKGVAAATGSSADDQIIFSSAVPLQPQPLGLRAVDASLKQFIGNVADYVVNRNYFQQNAVFHYFSGYFYYYSCAYGPGYYGTIDDYYYGAYWPCTISYVPIYGYYWDYSGFSEQAVAVWTSEAAVEAGTSSAAESAESAQQAAEDVLEVEIGGWDFPDEDDDLLDPAIRKGLETFMAVFGIGEANAQEVETEEADLGARQPNVVYVTGHHWLGVGPMHTALEYRDGPTDHFATTISARRISGKLVARFNRVTDHPLTSSNATLGVVGSLSYPAPALLWGTMQDAMANYDDDLDYCVEPDPNDDCYNSNSFTRGMVDHTNGAVTWSGAGYDDWGDFWGGDNPVPSSALD